MKHYFVVEIVGDVDPVLHGPFYTVEGRDKKALSLRENDPEKRNGIYRLMIENNVPVISAYMHYEINK